MATFIHKSARCMCNINVSREVMYIFTWSYLSPNPHNLWELQDWCWEGETEKVHINAVLDPNRYPSRTRITNKEYTNKLLEIKVVMSLAKITFLVLFKFIKSLPICESGHAYFSFHSEVRICIYMTFSPAHLKITFVLLLNQYLIISNF